MAKRKFSKKAMVRWLDILAKVCVKTRDGFVCEINITECDHIKCGGCSGRMEPLSYDCQWCHIKSARRYHSRWKLYNALCGCAHCHRWAHDNPTEFGQWFAAIYPDRAKILAEPRELRTWREEDFRLVEHNLLVLALELNVNALHFPKQYRKKFEAKLKELK